MIPRGLQDLEATIKQTLSEEKKIFSVNIGSTTIIFSVQATKPEDSIFFKAKLEGTNLPNLSDILSFFGVPQDNYIQALPEQLRKGKGFSIEDIRFEVLTKTQSLKSVVFFFGVPNLKDFLSPLTISGTKLHTTITEPLDKEKRSIQTELSLNITAGEATFEASAKIPGALKLEGKIPSFNLKSLLTSLCSDIKALSEMPDLKLPESEISIEKDQDKINATLQTKIDPQAILSKDLTEFLKKVDIDVGTNPLETSVQIGINPFSAKLNASIPGQKNNKPVKLGDAASLVEPSLVLGFENNEFFIGIDCNVIVKAQAKDLVFDGTIKVETKGAAFVSTMKTPWTDAFGVSNLTISNLSLDLGLSWTLPAPTIGLAGHFDIGKFNGDMAIKLDSIHPTQSMLAASLNEIRLDEVISTFCPPQTQIPSEINNFLTQISLSDVQLYVVPQDTTIGTGENQQEFQQGLRFDGTLHFLDFKAGVNVEVEKEKGISFVTQMSPITICNVLHLSDSSEKGGPMISLATFDRPPENKPHLTISGKASVKDIFSSDMHITFSNNVFSFEISPTIFECFNATIKAENVSLNDLANSNLTVTAQMDTKKIDEIMGKVTESSPIKIDTGELIKINKIEIKELTLHGLQGSSFTANVEGKLVGENLQLAVDFNPKEIDHLTDSIINNIIEELKKIKLPSPDDMKKAGEKIVDDGGKAAKKVWDDVKKWDPFK